MAFARRKSQARKPRSNSALKEHIVLDPHANRTLEELGVKVKKARAENFIMKNLSLDCLYLLVLRKLCLMFNLIDHPTEYRILTRRNSDESIISGRKPSKKLLGNSVTTYKDIILAHHLRMELRRINLKQRQIPDSSNRNLSPTSATNNPELNQIPWYLDPNKVTLKQSLDGLKVAIARYAQESEVTYYGDPELLAMMKDTTSPPHQNVQFTPVGVVSSNKQSAGFRALGIKNDLTPANGGEFVVKSNFQEVQEGIKR